MVFRVAMPRNRGMDDLQVKSVLDSLLQSSASVVRGHHATEEPRSRVLTKSDARPNKKQHDRADAYLSWQMWSVLVHGLGVRGGMDTFQNQAGHRYY